MTILDSRPTIRPYPLSVRLIIATIGLALCLWLLYQSGQRGLARLLSNYGAGAGVMAAIDEAIKFAPHDPDAHYVRALALAEQNEFARAAAALQQAAALRSHDYRLWLELGNACDQAGDLLGAIAALTRAVQLAPYYAQPQWQLGNVLLRAGRFTEAFTALRHAVTSDPTLAPQAIDLAYGIYKGEAQAVVQAIQPQTPAAQMALAIQFAQHRQANEALQLFRNARVVTPPERRTLIAALLSTGQFAEAQEVWRTGRTHDSTGSDDAGNPSLGALTDGSFEEEIKTDEPGFGWQATPATPAVKFTIDNNDPRVGKQSLQLSWNGAAVTGAPVFSQVVLVAPQTRYQLHFAARTRKLVTGGLPIVAVRDAAAAERQLAHSEPLPAGDNSWRPYTLEFTTAAATRAILITIERQNCSMTPCPIFGQTWFDDFRLSPHLRPNQP
jgi:Flp pilus assembly protein TadD